jgi:hypothetical protein
MTQIDSNWKKQILEQDVDISQLEIKDKLSPSFWNRGQLAGDVVEKLLEIATDFYSSVQESIKEAPDIEDITFTGSLASYNYHENSDIDLHILVDLSNVGKSKEMLSQIFALKRIQWNRTHDIMIMGHEVEIYIQDAAEDHQANGIFSIQDREWIEMPVKESVNIDYDATKKKYEAISMEISELYNVFKTGDYKKVHNHASKLKEKVKNMRKSGLKGSGAYSSENLAFKMLRMSDDLEKLTILQHLSYDKMMSMPISPDMAVSVSENWFKFLKEGKV